MLKRSILLGLLVPLPVQAQAPAAVREARAAWMANGPCNAPPPAPAAAALIGAVAGLAGDFVIGALDRWLKARKAGLAGEFLATGVGGAALPACLHIYRGPVDSSGLPAPAVAAARGAFYLQADVSSEGSSEAAVWTVAPYRLVYNRSVAKTQSKTKNVSLVIALSDAAPAANTKPDAGKPLAVFRHDLGELTVGRSYGGNGSRILEGTAASHPVKAGAGFNIAALVTESRDPGPALEALVGAMGDNKDDLSSALADLVKSAVSKPEK